MSRNSCDQPLTSTAINNHDLYLPIEERVCHPIWFCAVLKFGITFILITTCCSVREHVEAESLEGGGFSGKGMGRVGLIGGVRVEGKEWGRGWRWGRGAESEMGRLVVGEMKGRGC